MQEIIKFTKKNTWKVYTFLLHKKFQKLDKYGVTKLR